VDGHVLMPFLVSRVFRNKVEIFPTDDDGSGHFGGNHTTSKDSSSDRDLAGKGALFIDVGAIDGFGGSLEAKTNILVPPSVL